MCKNNETEMKVKLRVNIVYVEHAPVAIKTFNSDIGSALKVL